APPAAGDGVVLCRGVCRAGSHRCRWDQAGAGRRGEEDLAWRGRLRSARGGGEATEGVQRGGRFTAGFGRRLARLASGGHLPQSAATRTHRTNKREHQPGPLRPTVAAAMVRLAEARPKQVVLDPMCGAGTILAEQMQTAWHPD